MPHRYTMASLTNFASLLKDQGRLDEAGSLFKDVLQFAVKQMGPQHPTTLMSKNNLGYLLMNQGNLDEAEILFREVLEANARQLGLDHPETVVTKINLVELEESRGRICEAVILCRQAIDADLKHLGKHHWRTVQSMSKLVTLLQRQGRNHREEAVHVCREVLHGRQERGEQWETVQGNVAILQQIATLYHEERQLDKAEPILREVLDYQRQYLEPQKQMILVSTHNLAMLLLDKGSPGEAEKLLEQALQAACECFGSRHSQTLIDARPFLAAAGPGTS